MACMRNELQTLMGGIKANVGPKLPETNGVSPPFFGRGPDLAVLRRVMQDVRTQGECRAVTIVGAAGIGKTRLIDEFIREVAQLDNPSVRTFRSVTPPDGSTWSSFNQLLAQRFEMADSTGLEQAKASVHKQMAQVLDDRKVGDVLYLLGDLLELEFPKSPLTRAFEDGAPETDVVKRTILKSFLEADAALGPLCLVFDDLHFAKTPTLEMLGFLVENLKAPVLFLCAGRPELLGRQEALPLHGTHTALHLEPLTALDSAALIGSMLTPEGMTPMHLVEKTRTVTGGNPGRIEEVARLYRDKGTLPPPPDSADAAVETRLEHLAADERRLLQKAAVMGGVFWLGGLIVLDRADRQPPELWNTGEDPGLPELTDCLARLAERDYVMRLPDSTFPADEEYVFRRRTERDRLTALTPPADARRWHRLLADWLDSQPETRSHEEYLELLAEQREQSGALDSAASVYLEAAGQARAHRAPKRELAFYERALTLLGEDGHSRRLTALMRAAELLEQVGNAALALARYREAATLAFRLDRRRLWETARLSMNRVIEAHAARIESQLPPAAEVAPEPPAPPPPAAAAEPPPTAMAEPLPAAVAEPPPAAVVEPPPAAIAEPSSSAAAEPPPAPPPAEQVNLAEAPVAEARVAEPAALEPPVSGQNIDLLYAPPSEPEVEPAPPAAPEPPAEPHAATAPAAEPPPESPSAADSSPADAEPTEASPTIEATEASPRANVEPLATEATTPTPAEAQPEPEGEAAAAPPAPTSNQTST